MPRKLQKIDSVTWKRNPTLFPSDEVGSDVFDHNYTWLLRSCDLQAEEARKLLTRWFNDFPRDGQYDLYRRFSSKDEITHISAFWELYCCALLQRQGFDVTVHPSVSNEKSTYPDFLACRGGVSIAYFELAAHSVIV